MQVALDVAVACVAGASVAVDSLTGDPVGVARRDFEIERDIKRQLFQRGNRFAVFRALAGGFADAGDDLFHVPILSSGWVAFHVPCPEHGYAAPQHN
jgi:hypothetical protein